MLDRRIEGFLSTHERVEPRSCRETARHTLLGLGIPMDSDLAELYMRYQGPFVSPQRFPELLDIEYPTAEVVEQTAYVRAEYGVPEDFVCFTTTEGEGMYLYQISTGGVYDIGIDGVSELGSSSGTLAARWESVNDFLLEFFALR